MKFRNVKSIEQQIEFSPNPASTFHWFIPPHMIEYQKILKLKIYCPFHFGDFPFDQHKCNFTFGYTGNDNRTGELLPSIIRHEGQRSLLGQEGLKMTTLESMPFDITLTSLEPHLRRSDGFYYSYAGVNIHSSRNTLGVLLGGFYLPTSIFAILSLISFNIDPDIVITVKDITLVRI